MTDPVVSNANATNDTVSRAEFAKFTDALNDLIKIVSAQRTEPTVSAPQPATVQAPQQPQPQVYYVKDANGNFVAVEMKDVPVNLAEPQPEKLLFKALLADGSSVDLPNAVSTEHNGVPVVGWTYHGGATNPDATQNASAEDVDNKIGALQENTVSRDAHESALQQLRDEFTAELAKLRNEFTNNTNQGTKTESE